MVINAIEIHKHIRTYIHPSHTHTTHTRGPVIQPVATASTHRLSNLGAALTPALPRGAWLEVYSW